MGQICPRGGVISGSSSLVHFDAWNWEDAQIKTDEGIHLNWPKYLYQSSSKNKNKLAQYSKKVKTIYSFFENSIAYSKGVNKNELDLKMQAMTGLFSGKKQLYVHADYIKELSDIINFKKKFNIQRLCIIGGYDSWMIAKRLKENNISIMLPRTHSLPRRSGEDIHFTYKIPFLLEKEGVLFCIQNSGSMEQMQTRNLPFLAGTAVAYGLDYESGVAAISLNAAKILGVDDQLGSIDVGKQATIFISSGDALDMMTNKIEIAYINGRSISLNNDQIRNFNKYKKKYDLD